MSSSSSSPASPPFFRTRLQEVSLGMVMLGLIFSSMLYGIMLTQVYKYYRQFKKDPRWVKLLVAAVWLLNTVSVFFVGHACWYYLVTTGPRSVSVWSLNVELALSMVMSGISETFLAFRVYKLSGRNVWLTSLLLAFACLHFSSGEVAAAEFLHLRRFAKFGSVKVPSILRLSSAALTDTLIAMSLCYFLNKKRTGFKRTDEAINYLILFSINSGLLTSVTSIASLITYLVVPRTWVYTALCFLISRLYANTFLCSLNSRDILLQPNTDGNEKQSPIPHMKPRKYKWSKRSSDGSAESPTQIDVFVVTETVTDGLPQVLTSAKVRNPINGTGNLRDIQENSSSSTLDGSASSRSAYTT